MSRHNTTRNGVYGLAARYALAILAWIVASAGVSAQPFQQFEDDNTQMKFEGANVHVCKGNSLLIGVDVEKNRFLCQTVNEPLGQLFVDKDTHAPGLNTHTCPTFASMVGLSVDKNWLICAQLPPTGWVAGDSLFGSLTVDGPQAPHRRRNRTTPAATCTFARMTSFNLWPGSRSTRISSYAWKIW